MKLATILIFILFSVSLFAQGTDAKIDSVADHNDWGWRSIVMSNGLVTLATMPDLGGRIMQYDLGGHSSVWVNPDTKYFGKVLNPNQNDWRNYGGYKVWPAPQSKWGWKPPAQLDAGHYESRILDNSADSVSVFVRSPKAVWTKHKELPGLQFERRSVMYKGSSRVKVEQSMINTTSEEMSWSIWDVTQSIVQHDDKKDGENFWVYFPIRTDGSSVFGDDGVKTSKSSSAWVGEVAPGIFGVQFKPENKKIFADSPEGWIAYVDELEGKAYFKVFELYEGAEYPDDGAVNEVWISNLHYLEVEVVSPIWDIAPNGGKITFVEDWYAATMFGPVLGANHVGAISQKITYKEGTPDLEAAYGIFYEGTAKVVFLDAAGAVLAEGQSYAVSPMSEFKLAESLEQPAGAATIEVRVYNKDGEMVGAVESKPVETLTNVDGSVYQLQSFQLEQNYPNPFNPTTTIEYVIENSQPVTLAVYDMNGRLVETLVNEFTARGSHKVAWNASEHAAGVYFARLQADGQIATSKMILLK